MFNLIEKLAAECRMPLCYGGGIKSAKQAKKIFNLGVEKIAISSASISNSSIITELAESVGITLEQYPAWLNSMHELGAVAVSDKRAH